MIQRGRLSGRRTAIGRLAYDDHKNITIQGESAADKINILKELNILGLKTKKEVQHG